MGHLQKQISPRATAIATGAENLIQKNYAPIDGQLQVYMGGCHA